MSEIQTLPGTDRYLIARRIVPRGEANIYDLYPEQIKETISEVHYVDGSDPQNVGLEGTYGIDLPPDLAQRVARATNLVELVNISAHGMGYAASTGEELEDLEVEPVGAAPRLWRAGVVLDQGREGSCVGHGVRAWINGEPVMTHPQSGDSAPDIYRWCQQNDGANLPIGTTIEAGVKYCVRHGYALGGGYVRGYDAFASFLSTTGGIFVGADWYEGMHRPDSRGYVRPTGQRTGGHCVWVHELLEDGGVGFQNSWGRDWGSGGFGRLSREDLRRLMSSDHWTAAALVQEGEAPGPGPQPGERVLVTITGLYQNSHAYQGKKLRLKSRHGFGWDCEPLED